MALATTPNVEAATFNPVFYYHHSDPLGSSNVMTDRPGNRVQHYEYTTYGNEGFKDNPSDLDPQSTILIPFFPITIRV